MNITKEEYKKLRKALNYYMQDLIKEKDAEFYSKVIKLSNTSIHKEDDCYLVLRKYRLVEENEKRDFVLLGKMKDDEITINIDEKIVQGELNYSRVRHGKYTIENDTIRKDYSNLYYLKINDSIIPIEDIVWTEEEHFITGDNNLLTNYNNIEPVKKDTKIKSLHRR